MTNKQHWRSARAQALAALACASAAAEMDAQIEKRLAGNPFYSPDVSTYRQVADSKYDPRYRTICLSSVPS